jgi:hypothetical protein
MLQLAVIGVSSFVIPYIFVSHLRRQTRALEKLAATESSEEESSERRSPTPPVVGSSAFYKILGIILLALLAIGLLANLF